MKLRGLPFEAAPRDVTDWINKAVQRNEVVLSGPVSSDQLRYMHAVSDTCF